MKKRLSLAALLTLALTAGCGSCEQVRLTPEERAWFPAHAEGEQLFFRSNRGGTNTLTAMKQREWYENTDCNKLESGSYQPINVSFSLQSATEYDAKLPHFNVAINKTRPERPGRLTFSISGLEYPLPSLKPGPTAVLVQEPCRLTTGKYYPAAYVFRDGQNAMNYGLGHLRAFHWDKQDGLIRYELADGEVFERTAR